MSVAIELTQCQERIAQAGKTASATVRRLKPLLPVAAFDELMLAHCAVAAGALEFKVLLGSLRMMGELEQRPPEVTAESLERAQCGRRDSASPAPCSERDFEHFKHDLAVIGDDTFKDEDSSFAAANRKEAA